MKHQQEHLRNKIWPVITLTAGRDQMSIRGNSQVPNSKYFNLTYKSFSNTTLKMSHDLGKEG